MMLRTSLTLLGLLLLTAPSFAVFINGQPANVALRDPAVWQRGRANVPADFELARPRPMQRVLQSLSDNQRRAFALLPSRAGVARVLS